MFYEAQGNSSSAWNAASFSESERIEALRVTFQRGKKPTANQVIFLAAASDWARSLTKLTANTGDGNTFLHWCEASAVNTGGIKPFGSGTRSSSWGTG